MVGIQQGIGGVSGIFIDISVKSIKKRRSLPKALTVQKNVLFFIFKFSALVFFNPSPKTEWQSQKKDKDAGFDIQAHTPVLCITDFFLRP